jgi:hypothetical protein
MRALVFGLAQGREVSASQDMRKTTRILIV